MHQPISLNIRIGDNRDTNLLVLLENTQHDPDDHVIQVSLSTDLNHAIERLTTQQQQVLRLHYGLDSGRAHDFSQNRSRNGLEPRASLSN